MKETKRLTVIYQKIAPAHIEACAHLRRHKRRAGRFGSKYRQAAQHKEHLFCSDASGRPDK